MAWINGDPDPWSDERLNAEVDRFNAVLDRAAVEPSNGPSDLAAKARLLMCEWRTLVDGGGKTPGERALASLLREVAALGPVPSPHPDINLVDRLDLATATIEDLQALHDVAGMVSSVAYAVTWQGRCKARGPGGLYNVAGTLMQGLADALTDVEGAAAREARRRAPGNGNDREARLKLIAPMIIQNGDPEEVVALAHELADHATAALGAR